MTFLSLADKTMTFSQTFAVSSLGFGIVLAVLAVLAIFVILISKIFGNSKKKEVKEAPAEAKAEITPVAVSETPAENPCDTAKAPCEIEIPHIPGYVVLDGVSEQDAAVVMAITSHKTEIPLERLDFKSIKRLHQDPELINIEEQDAAVIMAITSDKTGIPLENLIFNSIKLVEE